MANIHYPNIRVEDIAARIAKLIEDGRGDSDIEPRDAALRSAPLEPFKMPRSASSTSAATGLNLPRFRLQPDFQLNERDHYHVNELLRFHDSAFVRNACRAILKREPDAETYHRHLERLRTAAANKIDVLAALRYSPEGRLKAVRVEGLLLPTIVRWFGRLPVIGYPVRLTIGLARLPNSIRHQQEFQAYSLVQQQQVVEHIDQIGTLVGEYLQKAVSAVQAREQDLADRLEEISSEISTRIGAVEQNHHSLGEREVELERHLEKLAAEHAKSYATLQQTGLELMASQKKLAQSLEETRANLQQQCTEFAAEQKDLTQKIDENNTRAADLYNRLQQIRAELTVQRTRVSSLFDDGRSFTTRPSQPAPVEVTEDHQLDAVYSALEDRFRGSREEIQQRNKHYLPHIKRAVANTGAASIVDIGCGRGEWLELLKEEGLRAIGVDTNLSMVARCRESGLEVIESSALKYLRSLPEGSLSAVTGFHIIEHLPVEQLMAVLDQVVRVLAPGGAVIFETPNPDNVLVGSNYFYLDPTHRHPLPSQFMEFCFEVRGLRQIQIMNLHPWDSARIQGDDPLIARFNELFYGPMDYAIVGWKKS